MNDFPKLISEYWHILSASVLVIIWLVRLEAKVLSLDKSQSRLETVQASQAAEHSKVVDQLSLINASLSRIEGRLEGIYRPGHNLT